MPIVAGDYTAGTADGEQAGLPLPIEMIHRYRYLEGQDRPGRSAARALDLVQQAPRIYPVHALRVWLDAASISAEPLFRSVAKDGTTIRPAGSTPTASLAHPVR